MQAIYGAEIGSYRVIPELLAKHAARKVMLVCDVAYGFLPFKEYMENLPVQIVKFSDFGSNPLYESVVKGVKLFNGEKCDFIIAVGGGSAIDVAKCIKLYCPMDQEKNYLEQVPKDTGIPLLAIPTTAGTGSESTHYAVIYYEGKKQSITHDSILPNYAFLEPSVLSSLPLYQKKCTMLDALCQGIESWWSVNSNEESKEYSRRAVQLIISNWKDYIFENSSEAATKIMLAANLAGRAINITQTTAAHAMSYKITSLYNIPHGYAVALCLPGLWGYMLNYSENTNDPRGKDYLLNVFEDIAKAMECKDSVEAITYFRQMLKDMAMPEVVSAHKEADLDILADSVNPVRLKNNPVSLTKEDFRKLYEEIIYEG